MNAVAVERYAAAFEGRAGGPDDPHWLGARREAAFSHFHKAGFPTRGDEHWKYTDVSAIVKEDFTAARGEHCEISDEAWSELRYPGRECRELVFIDGRFAPRYSKGFTVADEEGQGKIIVTNLRRALREYPHLAENVLSRHVDYENHTFAALNASLFEDGAFIYLPDDAVAEQPVAVHFISACRRHHLAVTPRNLIVLGKRARATVVESFHGLDGVVGFTNTITEIDLAEEAALSHYKDQRENTASFHIGGTHCAQRRGSRVESHSLTLGARIARNDVVCDLAESGAELLLNGLYLGADRQHLDNHTLVHHASPHTRSREYYRGILDDHARGVFNGKVIVHKDAQKTAAEQSNANLILSDHAEVDTKPELEIYADDVQCSHGATVGQLDKEALFYLLSRGLDEKAATRLLMFAFVEEILQRIDFAPLRKRLEREINGGLAGVDWDDESPPQAEIN